MGSQEIRSFLGGWHKDDKGLYVSTADSPRTRAMKPNAPAFHYPSWTSTSGRLPDRDDSLDN
jgi:restriction system protein